MIDDLDSYSIKPIKPRMLALIMYRLSAICYQHSCPLSPLGYLLLLALGWLSAIGYDRLSAISANSGILLS
jgi:hypothetical protein